MEDVKSPVVIEGVELFRLLLFLLLLFYIE